MLRIIKFERMGRVLSGYGSKWVKPIPNSTLAQSPNSLGPLLAKWECLTTASKWDNGLTKEMNAIREAYGSSTFSSTALKPLPLRLLQPFVTLSKAAYRFHGRDRYDESDRKHRSRTQRVYYYGAASLLAAGGMSYVLRSSDEKQRQTVSSTIPSQWAVPSFGPWASSVAECSTDTSAHPPQVPLRPLWRSEANQPLERKLDDALIFCGTSNEPLARAVADRLGTRLGHVFIRRFADGEVFMQFLDSMRGKDVYLIQPTSPPVNDNLVELLLMVSTCRRSSARKITAIIPYYGYARQDRKLSSRVPISAADVACMIQAMGVDRVVAVDLHCGQIQGFFGPRVPVDNLEAQIIGLDHFNEEDLYKPIIISPDAGGVYRAKKFQEGLISKGYIDCGIAMLIKQRVRANEVSSVELVGNVSGSDVIIVDDMIDTARTLCEAARVLREHGARRVFAFATHGLFSRNALQLIEESPLERVIVTDSIKTREEVAKSSKIHILSVSVLVADAIRRIHQKESLTELFKSPKDMES